ncbi:hypothetical protein [Flavobacterium sp. ZB4R12]|uniref:hypothetical protein n=1 Tax=Flavobacterium sp. ZB4R12 TaxID=3398732 RepID=UPI003AAF67FE
MSVKNKYFCTREWGFGSNIVNYLKSAMFCHQNNYNLILQDRNNSIGKEFNLFSVIELPDFIQRTNIIITIPVENFKSLVKFNLFGKYTRREKVLYSFCYLTGMKSGFFIKNFNLDSEINSFFSSNYIKYAENSMKVCWKYNFEIKDVFKKFEQDFKCQDFQPNLSIQIRGGDKIEESLSQGVKPALVDNYLDICLDELKKIDKTNVKIYVMTDTYSYFKLIKERLEVFYPNADIRSFANPNQEGYLQADFNDLEIDTKIDSYYFFLYELEMLRKAPVCVGSFNSNIFYLASLIRYEQTSTFISVDSTFENSFL